MELLRSRQFEHESRPAASSFHVAIDVVISLAVDISVSVGISMEKFLVFHQPMIVFFMNGKSPSQLMHSRFVC